MKRLWVTITLALLAVYLGGYVVARETGVIVHYVTYHTDAQERLVYDHSIDLGGKRDTGMPVVLPPSYLPIKVFAPLVWLETHAWQWMRPYGTRNETW